MDETPKTDHPEAAAQYTPPSPEVQPPAQPMQMQPIQPAPQVAQVPVADIPKESHNAGNIVLQWLTYAFWGWTVLATSILVATVLANLISKSETGGFMPYGIAAVLVLLPISVVCDVFYSKQEPLKKTGAASIVMVIHAVLFALFGIGSLITAVISLVMMFTNSSDSSGTQTALFSALIIFILYVMTFLRTINPPQIPLIRRLYPIFMVGVVGIIAIMGVVGPLANAHKTKDDKLIENNVSSIQSEIEHYVGTKDALPTSLDSLSLVDDEAKAAELIEYKPNTKAPKTTPLASSTYYQTTSDLSTNQKTVNKTFYYQLCVTYKEKSSGYHAYDSYSSDTEDSDGYANYVSSYSHPAGRVCYKLSSQTNNY
jgi:type II secretory pathway pseudopilin PulG